MNDVMLDLETLGTHPGCTILSIGAVAFDPVTGAIGPEFHAVVNRVSCYEFGLREQLETLAWWNEQSEEAKTTLKAASGPGSFLIDVALRKFSFFLREVESNIGSGIRVWGNGADFDQPILAAAYHATATELPWKHWNSRCYRTLKSLDPMTKAVRDGTHHNAVDDARTQAIHACLLMQRVRAGLPS